MSRLRRLLLDLEPLRVDRDFRYLWSGQVLSAVGREVTRIALPYQVYVLTGSALAIGGIALVELIPLLLFSLAGGTIADAVERRRLMIVCQIALAATSGALVLLSLSPDPPLLALYAIAFIAGSVAAIERPARSSAIPRLVPRERLPAALATNMVGFTVAGVCGPALGGIIIGTLGLPAAYLLDTLSFGAALVGLLLIRPIPPLTDAVRPGLAAVIEGFRYVRRMPVLLSAFVVDLDAMIFGLPVALFPIMALDVFHAGPEGVGLLTAAPAAGALVGALFTGWVGRVRFRGRAVIVAVLVWGLAITGFGLATFSFPLALLFLAIAGAADVYSAVFRGTILQLAVPDHLRGRLSAMHLMVVQGGPRLGDLEATAVAAAVNAPFSAVSGGVLCIVGVLLVAWRLPQLAAYDSHAPHPDALPAAASQS
jgi:MFS family permease